MLDGVFGSLGLSHTEVMQELALGGRVHLLSAGG
jgi:hypothetical protein